MFSSKKNSVPGQMPNHDMATKEQTNFGHSMSFPDQHSFQSKNSLDKSCHDSGTPDDVSRNDSKHHLSAIDREEMEKMFSPAQRFDDVLRVIDDRVPELFVPADTHHYDDEDYRNHRHRSYPHMHQPLKSMEPRALRKIKDRIRQCKEAERRAAHSGVATSVPQLLSRAQASGNTSHVVHLAASSSPPCGSGSISGPLILAPGADIEACNSALTSTTDQLEGQATTPKLLATTYGHKKRKRRRHRSKKAEPFLPTLSHLSEESATPSSLSSPDEEPDDEDRMDWLDENDKQMISDKPNEQDTSETSNEESQTDQRPILLSTPSWPGALIQSENSDSPASYAASDDCLGYIPQMSFLEEIATEILPVSFMEHTKGASYSRNLSMPLLSGSDSPRSQSPLPLPPMSRRQSLTSDSSGSLPKLKKISFADQQPNVIRCFNKLHFDEINPIHSQSCLVPLIEEIGGSVEDKIDLDLPDNEKPGADIRRKPSFHLGGEYQFPDPSQQSSFDNNSPLLSDEDKRKEGLSHSNSQPVVNPTDEAIPGSGPVYHRSNSSRFYHREHYRAKDLRERTFSGIELRDLQQEREMKQVTEAEEADTLIAADLNTIFSHRFEDMPAFRNRMRRPPPLVALGSMKAKNAATTNNSGSQTMTIGGDSAPSPDFVGYSLLHPTLSQSEGDYNRHLSSASSNIPHPLFVEMDVLSYQERHQQWQWREKARWIRYEEDLNEAADRFDPAHCPPLRFHTLLQFRRYLEQSTILLDLPCETLKSVTERIVQSLQSSGTCSSDETGVIEEVLKLRHIHVGETSSSNVRTDLSKSRGQTTPANMNLAHDGNSNNKPNGVEEHEPLVMSPSAQQIDTTVHIKSHPSASKFFRRAYKSDLAGRLRGGFESVSVNVGCLDRLRHPVMIFVRLANDGLRNSVVDENSRLTEIDEELPVRFIFFFIGPSGSCLESVEYTEIGRVFSTMMIDPNFRTTAYSAQNRDDLLEGLRLFLDNSVVVPLLDNDWNARALIEMNTHLKNYMKKREEESKIKASQQKLNLHGKIDSHSEATSHHSEDYSGSVRHLEQNAEATSQFSVMISSNLQCADWLCPPFGSLYRDLKGYRMRFFSDFIDAFTRDNIGTVLLGILFVYFAVLAPAITFGALMNQTISESFGIPLCLISSGVFQLLFTLIGGQPMLIIGITGPIFIIEASTYLLSINLGIDLFLLRFWVAAYAAMFGLLIVGLNLVIIVRFIRRSVEEIFNTFVGFYYLFKALFTMLKYIPSTSDFVSQYNSSADLSRATNITELTSTQHYSKMDLKRAQAATTFFLAFVMLAVCLALVELKRGKYFTRKMRIFLGSFNVPLGIVVVVLLERVVFYDFNLARLNIPTLSSGGNSSSLYTIPDVIGKRVDNFIMMHSLAALVGVCLTMLICTETMISGVSVAKAERKLTKPCLFSLDFFVSLVIFPILSGVLGWPFVSGAVVKSNSHVIAMTKWDHKTVPGVPHRILGCAEQRISGTAVGALLALSILFGPLLKYIPMAAMYGIFLYMGIMGLRDLQFVRRTMSLMKRRKHWPETDYLRNLRVKHFLALGAFQGLTIGILITFFCLKEFANFAYPMFFFPIILLIYALSREFLMPKWAWFNRHLEEMDSRHKIVLLGFTISSVEKSISEVDAASLQPNFCHTSKSQSALTGDIHHHPAGLRNRLRSVPADLERATHHYLVLPAGVDPDIEGQLIERREFDEENPYPHG